MSCHLSVVLLVAINFQNDHKLPFCPRPCVAAGSGPVLKTCHLPCCAHDTAPWCHPSTKEHMNAGSCREWCYAHYECGRAIKGLRRRKIRPISTAPWAPCQLHCRAQDKRDTLPLQTLLLILVHSSTSVPSSSVNTFRISSRLTSSMHINMVYTLYIDAGSRGTHKSNTPCAWCQTLSLLEDFMETLSDGPYPASGSDLGIMSTMCRRHSSVRQAF